MTHSATLLALDALAVFRLTRLIVADTITAPLRSILSGAHQAPRAPGQSTLLILARPRLAEFITCPWCVSIHVAAAVTAAQALAPAVWIFPACALAFSAIAGLLSEHA